MKYPHFSELSYKVGLIAIPVVALFVWLFNSYRMGKFSKHNKDCRLWIAGGVFFTLFVIAFLIWCIGKF